MALAKISPAQAATINLARQHAGDGDRKAIKKEVFATIKAAFGIPADIKLKVETTDTASADYLVIKSKDDAVFNLSATGRWDGVAPVQTEAKRWFFVSKYTLMDLLIAEVTSVDEFDDGLTIHQMPDDLTEHATPGATVIIGPTGGAYVLTAESEF
jgi:hypothetical protein